MPQPNSPTCENNWQTHESMSKNAHTHRGQITPGQMGTVDKRAQQKRLGGRYVMFTPLLSEMDMAALAPVPLLASAIPKGAGIKKVVMIRDSI